ncbi:MAG: Gfo/Idh/MocA family oxidoreductase [Candidatus Omnitrophica bacterium]|nr:Gfo/Idh/MocA family oxidoreductase [Candidatus Omnitrophota bacterium]
MKFGIVGAGVIAEYHLEAIRRTEKAEIAGVYDKFPEAAKAFGEKHSIPVHPSIESLVQEGGAEVITIGTPSGWHLEPATQAMEAGAHVLCEKPLEVTLDRIDRMIEVGKKMNKKIGGILQVRTFPGCQQAKRILEEGRLGKLLLADAFIKYYRTQEYYESAGWRGTFELDGGGAAMNQGIHWIDLIQWLAGGAESVCAHAATVGHQIEVEDVCLGMVQWKNGARGVIEATTCAQPGFATRIEFHGEKGSLLLEDSQIKKFVIDGEDQPIEEGTTGAGGHADPKKFSVEGHVIHVQDMIEAIEQDRDPLIPGHEARKSVELIVSMYESSKKEGWVNLDD